MNIACATDDNYVQHCGVMLTSLFENNRNECIHIYLLTTGLTEKNKTSLENIVKHYQGYFHYCIINYETMKDLPVRDKNEYITIASYNRLLITQFLPNSENKVIYLDCDLIVCSSLKELWNTNIKNHALGAIKELWYDTELINNCKRLGYDFHRYSYFNAGVLIINLDYWRKEELQNKFFDYIKNHRNQIVFHDQDVLNALLHKNWLELDHKWNLPPVAYQVQREKILDPQQLVKVSKAVQSPGIVHFITKPKPWETTCRHPLKNKYFHYLKKTEWKNYKAPSNHYLTLKYCAGCILRSLKLRKRFYIKLH